MRIWPAQKAAARACRNAIEFNSLPAIKQLVPNGYDGLLLHVKIGVPKPVSPTFRQRGRYGLDSKARPSSQGRRSLEPRDQAPEP